MSIVWEDLKPGEQELDFADECQCPSPLDNCVLEIEEGQAHLRHLTCGRTHWLYPEDLFAEFPVRVTIDTCSNPGGWHGMELCDCGPEVTIEYRSDNETG